MPYIYEDYVSNDSVAQGLRKIFDLNSDERKALRKKVHSYANTEFSYNKTVDLWHDSLLNTINKFKTYRKWEKITF